MAISKLGAMVIAKPGEAAHVILRALDRAAGSRKRAALLLNIPPKCLYSYIRKLGLWADIDKLVRERGYVDPYATTAAVRARTKPRSYMHGAAPAEPYDDKPYGYKPPAHAEECAPAPRRHVPVRFDAFDPNLADEAEGWSKYP